MFLEILTILIIAAIVMGIMTSVASAGDKFTMVSGVMFTIFGLTALYWTAGAVAPHLHKDSTVSWLYKPLASLPEWVGYVGAAITVVLWVMAIALLVDDFVHLPRRKKGGRI
ncbi:hypothetical protein GWK76_02615 [Candidatus Saccharibacteria bacterium oral taxon 488]|jgi:hypothetical protein|nr:hypothetical protein GWK76_02615 [Candidatus Saccharibacteria bacterium oral taxon 488]